MAPVRPKHTARMKPLNGRLQSIITVKYDSLEVDIVVVAPRPCGTAMRDTPAASYCSKGVLLREKRGWLYGSSRHKCIYSCVNIQKGRERKGGESNEWKIPNRLLFIYSSHAFLHLTQPSNVFSNQ